MSVAMGSGTETVHIRLLEEGVDVWRPVLAVALGGDVYRLAEQPIPETEHWEFNPGDEVVTCRRGTGEEAFLAALGRRPEHDARRWAS